MEVSCGRGTAFTTKPTICEMDNQPTHGSGTHPGENSHHENSSQDSLAQVGDSCSPRCFRCTRFPCPHGYHPDKRRLGLAPQFLLHRCIFNTGRHRVRGRRGRSHPENLQILNCGGTRGQAEWCTYPANGIEARLWDRNFR